VRASANLATGRVELLETLPTGTTVTVSIAHTTTEQFVLGASHEVTLATPLSGDEVLVAFVNGDLRQATVVGQLWHVDNAPTGALVVVRITKKTTQTFTTPYAFASDDDTVNAQASTLPLVIFGGQGDDVINGGSGGDIVLVADPELRDLSAFRSRRTFKAGRGGNGRGARRPRAHPLARPGREADRPPARHRGGASVRLTARRLAAAARTRRRARLSRT
jgi:hypothetical protein